MAYGDIGGPITELILTCRTAASGTVDIARGDAVKLTGPYEITNDLDDDDPIFGQALANCNRNDAPLPVRVRGVCDFAFTGTTPTVDGVSGVVAADSTGVVKAEAGAAARGLIVKVDANAGIVETLL